MTSPTEVASKPIILVVDDTPDNLSLIAGLFKEFYTVKIANSGEKALKIAQSESKPALILLDVMMPNMDGFALAEAIRDVDPDVPLFFLSAKTMKEDLIQGYKLGADDYITKPFDSEVLLLKIKAILKRNEEQQRETEQREFDLASYHFNPRLRELAVGDRKQTLSPKENDLLKLLAEHLNDLLPREKALKKIWGSDTYFNGRSMDVYIAKLRKYLKEDSRIEIVNIHGEGFRLIVKE